MDKMRQEVENKLVYWKRMCALACLLCCTGVLMLFTPMKGGESFYDFFQGFHIGMVLVLAVYCIINICKFRNILSSEDRIREFYIKEHDERMAAIREKTGGNVMDTCGIVIIMAGVIAGYFNPVVFVTLIICGMFLLLVKKFLHIYYCKNM